MNRLQKHYHNHVVPALQKQLGLTHPLAAPKLVKIVISTSFREHEHQNDALRSAAQWMADISGQKPLVTVARKSIAGFTLRAGDQLGLKVTLRGKRLWEFLDKLISVSLPHVKDFQGLPLNSFDGHGNYTFGLTEQIIFPEAEYDKIGKIRGLQITIATTVKDDKSSLALLKELGFPFAKQEVKKL